MPRTQVDDTATPKEPSYPARHLPRLEQLLPRQASGLAHGARHAMEQRTVGKAPDIPMGQASA